MTEKLIIKTDPQPIIRKNAEQNTEWEYQPIADKWYPRLEEIKKRFFDGVLKPWDQTKLPEPPIAIEDMRNKKVLASYRLIPDGYGLNDKLTLNAEHFDKVEGKWEWDYGGEWGLSETIVHEMAHEWHKRKGKTKPSHNKEFTDKLEQLGIHCNDNGAHTQIADENSPFGILMKEWGIKRPEMSVPTQSDMDWFKLLADLLGKDKKGRSSLKNWVCPECGIHARMGISGDPELIHKPCSVKTGKEVMFVRADTLAQGMLGIKPEEQWEAEERLEREEEKPEEDLGDLSTYLEPYQNDSTA